MPNIFNPNKLGGAWYTYVPVNKATYTTSLNYVHVHTYNPLSECFTRAEKLRQQQEELILKRAQRTSQTMDTTSQETTLHVENSGSSDEMDFDEFLDWRAKIS